MAGMRCSRTKGRAGRSHWGGSSSGVFGARGGGLDFPGGSTSDLWPTCVRYVSSCALVSIHVDRCLLFVDTGSVWIGVGSVCIGIDLAGTGRIEIDCFEFFDGFRFDRIEQCRSDNIRVGIKSEINALF